MYIYLQEEWIFLQHRAFFQKEKRKAGKMIILVVLNYIRRYNQQSYFGTFKQYEIKPVFFQLNKMLQRHDNHKTKNMSYDILQLWCSCITLFML